MGATGYLNLRETQLKSFTSWLEPGHQQGVTMNDLANLEKGCIPEQTHSSYRKDERTQMLGGESKLPAVQEVT